MHSLILCLPVWLSHREVTNLVAPFWIWKSGPPCSWGSGSSSRNRAHQRATCLGDAGPPEKGEGTLGWKVADRDRLLDKGRKAKASYCLGGEGDSSRKVGNHPATRMNQAKLLGSEWSSPKRTKCAPQGGVPYIVPPSVRTEVVINLTLQSDFFSQGWMCVGLSETVPVYACCPGILINSAPSPSKA